MTLMSGFQVKPTPKVLVSFWGYGDVGGAWYNKPDPFHSKQKPVEKDRAFNSVGTEPITGTYTKNTRGDFYLYCRQNGLWTREVAGHDPDKEPEAVERFLSDPPRNGSVSADNAHSWHSGHGRALCPVRNDG